MPVYHEDVPRVTAGITATWESIARDFPEYAHHFDNVLLSDSRKLEYNIVEQSAVHKLRERFPQARFFYRSRPVNLNAKLGNVTDFCRRWGKKYEYMLVMDADCIMDGKAIVERLRMRRRDRRRASGPGHSANGGPMPRDRLARIRCSVGHAPPSLPHDYPGGTGARS